MLLYKKNCAKCDLRFQDDLTQIVLKSEPQSREMFQHGLIIVLFFHAFIVKYMFTRLICGEVLPTRQVTFFILLLILTQIPIVSVFLYMISVWDDITRLSIIRAPVILM